MTETSSASSVARLPLYRQVHDHVLARIVAGEWAPGEFLPSEQKLAADLGVAPGTVRRALDDLAHAGIVERRQGRGTAVVRHSSDRALFRFFRLVDAQGRRAVPVGRLLSLHHRAARAEEARALELRPGDRVVALKRERRIAGRCLVHETIALPERLFPRFSPPLGVDLSEELYVLYQRNCGVTIARAEDRIAAEAAPPEAARSLGISVRSPILCIRRIARALDGTAAEFRISRTAALHYAVAME